ncbi:hypothetical protein H072_10978 [Dactylellina haptotyla CBS 200.50]|uniref:Ubiquitin-like domain-containing protein n=1 Tax=Dactylellina haptotyla (strain CBS 200.50) TaxID=1284197 RepID=S8B937_DACHA|nr:hypothetical protein H072_10978 [Dactylellina haptotyla CBS 200.50]
MAALPAARPLTSLARSALTRSNGSSLPGLCCRCQVLASQPSSPASPSQRRYLNISWGSKNHVPRVPQRKGKRQRLIEAGRRKESMGAPKLSTEELKDVYASELFVFRSDISAGNLAQAMQSLTNLVELDVLQPNDTLSLAQAIHHVYRSRKVEKVTLMNYLKTFIEYIKAGQLPKHYVAQVHIISTLKEAEEWELGNEYWEWLRGKGLDYLDARVFGAAIEFLAYQGATLPELEGLYSLALERFAKQEDMGGGLQHRATRLMLVQGIISARILGGDWRRAYEALDLCARLHPTQVPTRVYEMFIFNRPVREAYLVFLMACRAGTKLNGRVLMWIMTNWWKSTLDVRGLLQLVLAHLAVGGKQAMEIMGKVIYGFLGRLPEAPEPPAPLTSLVKSELEGAAVEISPEEEERERKAWAEWDSKMEEYQAAVNPMFGCIRRVIEIFQAANVEPEISTYCNIISQASRRHLRPIVAGAVREVDSLIRSGRDRMDEGTWRVMLSAQGSLADQEGIRKAWDGLTSWRRDFLQNTKKARPGRTWLGSRSVGPEGRQHELISWKALIRACFQANMKPYILEQLQKYESEFDGSLTRDIRLELHRREGHLKKEQLAEGEMLHDAVTEGQDAITTAAPPPGTDMYSKAVLNTNYEELDKEIHDYNQVLDVMERVVKSPVAYDFSTLGLDVSILGLPETTDEDVRELQTVYEHFHKNMPRNPFLTATHDPKTDLAGIQKQIESQTEGAWGEGRSVTGYTINQLRFENWVSINQLLFIAEKGPGWRGFHLGAKGVTNSVVRREARAKAAIEKMEQVEGEKWEEEIIKIRGLLIGDVPDSQEEAEAQQAVMPEATLGTTETETITAPDETIEGLAVLPEGIKTEAVEAPAVSGETVAAPTGNNTAEGAEEPAKEPQPVFRIKELVEEKEGIPPAQQRLIFGGKQMYDIYSTLQPADDKAASEYNLEGGATLHLVLALRGGR